MKSSSGYEMIFVVLFFFAELFVSLKVGISIGFARSVIWILSTMVVGGLLLRLSPYALVSNFQTFSFGGFDLKDVQTASMAYLFGAVLLVVPGVLSDLIAVLLLGYTLCLHLLATIRPTRSRHRDPFHEGENNVIDVEIVDESDGSDSDIRSC
jgi:2-isopropylmalate synthase/UPF0716 protein FxsA